MSNQPDVSATLSDLERKLRDLERELAGVGSGPDPATPVAAAPAAPVAAPAPLQTPAAPTRVPLADPEAQHLVAEARASLGGLHLQLDDLVRVREELERSTRELMEEYRRVLTSLGVAGEGADISAEPAAPTSAAPVASAPVASAPVAPVAPVAPAPAVGTTAADATLFSGQVSVDAGPFTDIGTLSAFEQALGQVPGTQDVYVRGFEGSRALIDVILGDAVALGAELRLTAPVGFSLAATGPSHVTITIGGGQHA